MTTTDHYDAIVVGGRCAGAATGMLLARGGLRVLVLEASRASTDTLSTHALMRGAVVAMDRWGLLDTIIEAGTPAILATDFHYADTAETVHNRPGTAPLRAPRRTVLDAVLQDAARAAGADVRHGVRVTGLRRDSAGRVTGVDHLDRGGRSTSSATADITIGADGRRSLVADAVGAPYDRRGRSSSAFLYTYWSGPADATDLHRYRFFYRPGVSAGVIPTNDGQVCVWAGAPTTRFLTERRGDLDADYRKLLEEAAPELAGELATQIPAGRARGFPGMPGHLRQAAGTGWALVGDAGYFKDPITAHGITDALRDAELLARAVLAAPRGGAARSDALRGYHATRNALSERLFAVTDRIASYDWDLAELRDLLIALSAAMRPEVEVLRGLDAARPVAA